MAGVLRRKLSALAQFFVPHNCRQDPDHTRRARLIVHFGIQGTLFGTVYAVFYFAIGHVQGMQIILICTSIFAAVPWILRRTGALSMAGHLTAGTMAAGFTCLTFVEGGIHSHAVAWLASVPLCALLILGVRPAVIWAAICFVVGASVGGTALLGWTMEPRYDPRWHTLVDAAGNVGIIMFLFVLGLIFELNRASAFDRMQLSLAELAANNDQLAHLNNEKTEFLGMAAHDLRNPLNAIIGFSSLLEIDPSPRVAETGGIISGAGQRMLDLITDLLDANAIEEGRYGAQLEPQNLRALVIASIQHNQLSADRKRITLDLRDDPHSIVQADRKATVQILDNLISNAVKYSPPGSRVTLDVQVDRQFTTLAVRDQGPGISAEDQAKLFRKHTRLSARPTGGESSVGLGLSIVKRLAETMGGTITCRSTFGEGSTFVLRLPTVAPTLTRKEPAGIPLAEARP